MNVSTDFVTRLLFQMFWLFGCTCCGPAHKESCGSSSVRCLNVSNNGEAPIHLRTLWVSTDRSTVAMNGARGKLLVGHDDDDVASSFMSSDVDDILGTNCDQCRSMVQCCFTSTETVRLIRRESAGRPPRLSHSSWTLKPAMSNALMYTGL